MNVHVNIIPMSAHEAALCGGGHAETMVNIDVDMNLPLSMQRETIVHEVIECFCPMWPHDAVERLAEAIISSLEQVNVY